jgi:hypothetical protein
MLVSVHIHIVFLPPKREKARVSAGFAGVYSTGGHQRKNFRQSPLKAYKKPIEGHALKNIDPQTSGKQTRDPHSRPARVFINPLLARSADPGKTTYLSMICQSLAVNIGMKLLEFLQ